MRPIIITMECSLIIRLVINSLLLTILKLSNRIIHCFPVSSFNVTVLLNAI